MHKKLYFERDEVDSHLGRYIMRYLTVKPVHSPPMIGSIGCGGQSHFGGPNRHMGHVTLFHHKRLSKSGNEIVT